MRLKTILVAAVAALVAGTMTAATAQTATADDHHHEGNVFPLEIADASVQPATEPIDVDDHGGHGHTYTPDYDGYVPTSYGGDCYDGVLAYASWYSEGDWYIVYDQCEMDRYGAGPTDWYNVERHEIAHTNGWGHGEEPRAYNAAFEPTIAICGC